MLVGYEKEDDIIGADVCNIYIDSNNVSKVRVYIGGNLLGVATHFEYDPTHNMYRVQLFKHACYIPLSATNCSPFCVRVSPRDANQRAPKVWLELAGASLYADIRREKEFRFTLMDGQSGKLIASQEGNNRYLLAIGVNNETIRDTSFKNKEDAHNRDIVTWYTAAFKDHDSTHFVKMFASGFAKSLPYICATDASNFVLKHENKPLEECLKGIWSDYQKTCAYKKTLVL